RLSLVVSLAEDAFEEPPCRRESAEVLVAVGEVELGALAWIETLALLELRAGFLPALLAHELAGFEEQPSSERDLRRVGSCLGPSRYDDQRCHGRERERGTLRSAALRRILSSSDR